MISRWTFGRRLAAGFGVACAVLLVIAGTTYRNTANLIDTEDWVSHTYEVKARLADLSAALTLAESSQRGFLITGVENHLDTYRAALTAVKTASDDVKHLTVDNSHQQERLNRLQALIDTRLVDLREAIDARRTGGVDAAARLLQQNGSFDVMEKIRATIVEADHEESELLTARNAASRNATAFTNGVIIWGGLAGLIAIAAIGSLITGSLGRQVGSAVSHVESSAAELQASANQQAQSASE
jgi:CHASE3 domain sensor protein